MNLLLGTALLRIGFFGQTGPLWVLLGFICFCVIVALLFKIVFLALPALGVKEPWISVIYWAMVLVLFLCFINYAFGFGWGT
jgi:hypothetical protein